MKTNRQRRFLRRGPRNGTGPRAKQGKCLKKKSRRR